MYQNPQFRKAFNWVMWATLVYIILIVIIRTFNSAADPFDRPSNWYEQLVQSAPIYLGTMLFWLGIGKAFSYEKESYIALGVFILREVLFQLIISNTKAYEAIHIQSLFILIPMLPYVVFGLLVFKDRRAWGVILLGLIVISIFRTSIRASTPTVITLLNNWLDLPQWSLLVFQFLLQTANIIVGFIVMSYGLYALQHKRSFWSFKQIDLSNTYSKGQATFIFIAMSLSLFYLFTHMSLIGLEFKLRYFGLIVSDISALLSVYLISIIYRNFLVEYSLTLHGKVSWWYFGVNIPIINLFAWFTAISKNFTAPKEGMRLEYFENSKEDTNNGIKALILFLLISLGFYLVVTLSSYNSYYYGGNLIIRAIFVMLLAIGFTALYLYNANSIWFLIGLNLLAIIYLMYGGRPLSSQNFAFGLMEIYITGSSRMMVMFALFHLSTLRNIDSELVAPKAPLKEGEWEYEREPRAHTPPPATSDDDQPQI